MYYYRWSGVRGQGATVGGGFEWLDHLSGHYLRKGPRIIDVVPIAYYNKLSLFNRFLDFSLQRPLWKVRFFFSSSFLPRASQHLESRSIAFSYIIEQPASKFSFDCLFVHHCLISSFSEQPSFSESFSEPSSSPTSSSPSPSSHLSK